MGKVCSKPQTLPIITPQIVPIIPNPTYNLQPLPIITQTLPIIPQTPTHNPQQAGWLAGWTPPKSSRSETFQNAPKTVQSVSCPGTYAPARDQSDPSTCAGFSFFDFLKYIVKSPRSRTGAFVSKSRSATNRQANRRHRELRFGVTLVMVLATRVNPAKRHGSGHNSPTAAPQQPHSSPTAAAKPRQAKPSRV